MSVHVMSWVFKHSEATLGDRLVLLVLADHAHEDGSNAWASVLTIGREARLSDRQVQRCLRRLEETGAIRQTGRSSHGTNVWEVVMSGGDILSPGGDIYADGGVTNRADGGDKMSPEPSLDQPSLEQPSFLEQELPPMVPRGEIAVALPANRPTTVAKKRVTDAEYELAAATLAAFNTRAGTRFQSLPDIERIIRRIREYPELGFEAHVAIILAVFAGKHWWDEPAPRIIYGNASIFESSLHLAAKPPDPNRTMTSDEIRALGRKLAEDENVIEGEAVEVGS